MKWNLRMVAAQRDIWRPTQLQKAFEQVDFHPSLSKVAALWSSAPVSVRLDDLDKICTALDCTVGDLLQAEPVARTADTDQHERRVAGSHRPPSGVRPIPRRGGRRTLPPN
ncbi:helix-turn-helix domain-containing protein [Nocardia sp. CY41]|uniref:helix-turn-helix domain-containing protein n=1 Tax=Nocardia sp. CY41 TaxID=2608686 RepID=UPI0019165E51|nr:helix-turn-helix transcriptional regulator [Nocardia sp. CY41]